MRLNILLLLLLLGTVATALQAQTKPPLSIQGTLKNGDGTAVADGRYNMTFRLYTASSGGTAVWMETQPNVSVRAGVYSAQLGTVTPINITFTENLFLGTTVGTGAELVPRTRLTSSPYALYAFKLGNDVPVGFVMPWASGSTTVPDGWLLCDGRALKSIQYPDLFSAIGTLWGNGSSGIGAGSGTDFNLPDLRGEFIRGAAAGANAGAVQGGATARPVNPFVASVSSSGAHEHSIGYKLLTSGGGFRLYPSFFGGGAPFFFYSKNNTFSSGGGHTHTAPPIGGGDSETRPRNVAMPYYIKFRN
ncbi:MAG: tail fiber protein [Haliscomenobacter sp.]